MAEHNVYSNLIDMTVHICWFAFHNAVSGIVSVVFFTNKKYIKIYIKPEISKILKYLTQRDNIFKCCVINSINTLNLLKE